MLLLDHIHSVARSRIRDHSIGLFYMSMKHRIYLIWC